MKLLTSLFLGVLLCGCAGPRRVSATEFQQEYAGIGQPQTMHTITYLGQRGGRAFLRRRSMSLVNQKKWSDEVLYVEFGELDPAFRESLPTGVSGDR